jgi:O-antigen/teichoic acid export membrane protein
MAALNPRTLVAYRAFSDAAGKGAQLLITLLAARRLTREGFGLLALGSTLGWLAAVASDFGIQLHVARAVALGPRSASDILAAWLRVRVWSSAVGLILVAAFLLLTRSSSSLIVLLFAGAYLVNGLIEFLYYFYRGLSRSDIESTLTLWQRLMTLVSAVVVLIWIPDVAALGVVMLLAAVVALVYNLHRASTLTAAGQSSIDPINRDQPSIGSTARGYPSRSAITQGRSMLWSEFLKDVFPVGAGILLSALYFRIDLFFVELWRGTSAVGLYNAVFRLVEALRLFPAAVLAVALPQLCRATGSRPLLRLATSVTVFGSSCTVVLWLAAGWLIPFLYGARYTAGVPVFRTLLLAFPLMSLNYALTHQLVAWHRHRYYAAVAAGALVFNVATNVALIPAFGLIAAAWTTVATEGIVTIGCLGSLMYLGWSSSLRQVPDPDTLVSRDAPPTVENLLVM